MNDPNLFPPGVDTSPSAIPTAVLSTSSAPSPAAGTTESSPATIATENLSISSSTASSESMSLPSSSAATVSGPIPLSTRSLKAPKPTFEFASSDASPISRPTARPLNLAEPTLAPIKPEILSRISAIAQGSPLPPLSEVLPLTRAATLSTARRQLTGTRGMTTTVVPSPTSAQDVPAVTTTQRLVALEASPLEGVPVATAIAITSAASILSALLFAVGLFTAWTYRKKWAKASESVQVQDRTDVADAVDHPESAQSNEVAHGAAGDPSLSLGDNNHTEDIYAMSAADDDSLRGSSVDENIQAKASGSTQLFVIMHGGAATVSGSQSVSSNSHEDVLSWSPADVQRWMDSVGFRREVVEMFKAHGIDGSRLLGLTDHILENEVGITSAALRASILGFSTG
ncbi:hypothetical protein HDU96_001084 [Phlyctochytrium bullatum]|nr:hypothetical protein HDU96_001084 [Phlyctochytrium bullatum]